jgi:hypothetical protein
MISILLIGDGPRDEATVPYMVKNILKTSIQTEFRQWAHLHGSGKGYEKKVRFGVLQARDMNAAGLLAVVDQDKARGGGRLRSLRNARDADRIVHPPFPTALGEAKPHGEAWLLDDPHAIRQVLELDGGVDIPNVRRSRDPKEDLNELFRKSQRQGDDRMDLLKEIAQRIDVSRCQHGEETGFSDFVEEVRQELGPLAAGVGHTTSCLPD